MTDNSRKKLLEHIMFLKIVIHCQHRQHHEITRLQNDVRWYLPDNHEDPLHMMNRIIEEAKSDTEKTHLVKGFYDVDESDIDKIFNFDSIDVHKWLAGGNLEN